MKKIILLIFLFNFSSSLFSQSITISATTNCFNPSVTVPFVTNIDGRPAYDTPNGNLGGLSSVQVSVFWSNSNSWWQINVGGGTIAYTNSTNSPNPPDVGWQAFASSFPLGTCTTANPSPTLSGDVSLPVELIFFKAIMSVDVINLSWQTASEINNDGFEIEKSKDGITWNKIFFEKGKGTTESTNEYQFSDRDPLTGINYYRLKQIDFDKKFEYSNIVAVDFLQKKLQTTISPNPFNEKVRIELSQPTTTNIKVLIYNSLGKNIENLIFEKEKNNQTYDVSHLENGIYFFQIIQGQNSSTHKIIKI